MKRLMRSQLSRLIKTVAISKSPKESMIFEAFLQIVKMRRKFQQELRGFKDPSDQNEQYHTHYHLKYAIWGLEKLCGYPGKKRWKGNFHWSAATPVSGRADKNVFPTNPLRGNIEISLKMYFLTIRYKEITISYD